MKQFVISLTFAYNADGDTTTAYFTDGPGWSTTPDDSPANTWIENRVLDPGSIRRALFGGARLWGQVRPTFGEIVLANSDGALDGYLQYGVDGQPIVIWWGEEGAIFPDDYDPVIKCYGHAMVADFDEIRIRLRDRLVLLEVPWCERSFTGYGGLEGDSEMADRIMPRAWRDVNYIPLVLVDAAKLIYLVSDKGVATSEQTYCKIYEGGVEISREANYASSSAILSTSPSSGKCKFWFNGEDGPVYVRLGSVPVYDLRAYLSISNGGTYDHPASAIISSIDGPDGMIYVDDPGTTYLDVLQEFSACGPYYFGFNRSDEWRHGIITPPESTALHTFTQHNASDFRRWYPEQLHAPAWKLTYRAGQTFPCATAGAASASMRDILSRETAYLTSSYENTSILDKHPSAPIIVIETKSQLYRTQYGASIVFGQYADLFMAETDFISLVSPFTDEAMTLDLLDTVAVRIPRFGMESGRNFRIVSIDHKFKTRQIHFGLWGPLTGGT